MKTIWKFMLNVTDRQTVHLPQGAEPLCVQVQNGLPCLWAVVDSERELEPRTFAIFGTGHEIPQADYEYSAYIDTFQMSGGMLVFHVFEINEE